MKDEVVKAAVAHGTCSAIGFYVKASCIVFIDIVVMDVGNVCFKTEGAYSTTTTLVAMYTLDENIGRRTFDRDTLITIRDFDITKADC
jgi:hypothetical protein